MSRSHVTHFIKQAFKRFRWLIAGQIGVACVWAFGISFRPYLVKIMLDNMVYSSDKAYDALIYFAGGYLVLLAIFSATFRFYDYVCLHLYPLLKRYLGEQLMDHMMGHADNYYQTYCVGDLSNKIQDVMRDIPEILKKTIDQFLGQALAFVIAVITLWYVDMFFAIALMVWVTVFISGSCFFFRTTRTLSAQSAEARSSVLSIIIDIFNNMMSIRLFNGRHKEKIKIAQTLDTYVHADQKRDWFFMRVFFFQDASFIIYQGVTLLFLINGFKQGHVTPGDFALILAINASIFDNLWTLLLDFGMFSNLAGGVMRALDLLLVPHQIVEHTNSVPLKITAGKIEFDRVNFSYHESKLLFRDKSLILKPQQKVGLVGCSGSGKSTFLNLILRFFDVNSGHIRIDGQDIAHVTRASLRDAVGVVPQHTVLFNDTIMENIRYGKCDATDEEVIKAAKKAHAHEFIMALPNGYKSRIGEQGVRLSGGQSQQITIARAILKNAPILIFDEITSQLDWIAESKIQESLTELMQGKTAIVIAHRLATLLHMDRILVLDQGKIIQDGNHYDLIMQPGLYRDLWQSQMGGFYKGQDVPLFPTP